MRALTFLHKTLQNSLTEMHEKRFNALFETSVALLNGASLTVTDLGRYIKGPSAVKHKIKKVDRLLNNDILHDERLYIYKQLCHTILCNQNTAIVLVDWSGCCSNERFTLQASLVGRGRSIPIYKEIHPAELQENVAVESYFFDRLKKILPSNMAVIIVTDAGFRIPTFRKVISLGWDFVGRIRNKPYFQLEGEDEWVSVKSLYSTAINRTKYIGPVQLGKTTESIECHLFTYQAPKKGRKKHRVKGESIFPDKEKQYKTCNNEPWALVSSIEGGQKIASIVKNIYKKRMQVEQNFRDDKNERWGFGFRYSRTQIISRLEILFLIATLGTVLLWLIGLAGELNKLERLFQANTIRKKRVLSLISLGLQIIRQGWCKMKGKDIKWAMDTLSFNYFKEAIA